MTRITRNNMMLIKNGVFLLLFSLLLSLLLLLSLHDTLKLQ